MNEHPAILILEDGRVFPCFSVTGPIEAAGDLLIAPNFAGYQRLLTNPENAGHLILMTYPHQGNTGWSADDSESPQLTAKGLLMAHYHAKPSHYLAQATLASVLMKSNAPGITGLDTRAITRHVLARNLRKALVTTNIKTTLTKEELAKKIEVLSAENKNYLAPGLLKEPGLWEPSPANKTMSDHEGQFIGEQSFKNTAQTRLIVWDLGAALSSLKLMSATDSQILLCPPHTPAEFFLKAQAQGLVILGGPDSLAMIEKYKTRAREILKTKIPVFAAGLGAVVLAAALEAEIIEHPKPIFLKPQTLKNPNGDIYPVIGGAGFNLKSAPENWEARFTLPSGQAAWHDKTRNIFAQLWPFYLSSPQPLWPDFFKAVN